MKAEDRVTDSHESYGLLSISRISGGSGPLFGSSINPGNLIRISISRAERHRDLSHDWYNDKEQLIEIDMSPAQYAEAITTLNCGVGTPCTIMRVGRKSMEECPSVERREQVNKEFEKEMKTIAGRLDAGIAAVAKIFEKPTISKADRKAIQGLLERARRDIAEDVPFMHNQWNEACDRTVMEAKAEIDAFMTTAIHQAGMEAIAGKMVQVPMIQDKETK